MIPPKERIARNKTSLTLLDRAMYACCCLLLATGLLNCAFKLLPPAPGFLWGCALIPLLVLFPAAFVSRRLFMLLAGILALFLLFNYASLPAWWALARDFIGWWNAGFRPANADFVHYYFLLIRLLLAVGVSLLLWLLLRLRTPFFLLLPVCVAAVAVMAANGARGLSLPVLLLASGLLPLAAVGHLRREPGRSGQAIALSLPPVLLLLLALYLALPQDTSAWRWQPLSTAAQTAEQYMRDRYQDWLYRNAALPSFDLADEYHSRHGGPITPGNILMLRARTSTPLLLKGSTYDYYTGHGWEKSYYYVETPLEREKRSVSMISGDAMPLLSAPEESLNYILGYVPDITDGHPLAVFTQQVAMELTLLHPQESRLFYAGRPVDFSPVEGDIPPYVEENSDLKSAIPLVNGCVYEITSRAYDRSRPGFTEAVSAFRAEDIPEGLPGNKLELIEYNHNRQLPMALLVNDDYAATRQLARDIVSAELNPGEERSAYEQMVLLERWLKENCRYTLSPETPPADQDFTLHFLQTREGYCAYYATAMVIMARMLDMPARYVTGYVLHPASGMNQYQATQANAHAWAEVFFEGIGWLTFDPTGQADYTEISLGTAGGMMERERFGTETPAETEALAAWKYWLLLWIPSGLLLAALAVILLRRAQARRAWRLPRLLRRFSPQDTLNLFYSDLIWQMDLLGWQRRPAETVIAFLKRMGVYLPAQAGELEQLALDISALRYGNLMPDTAGLQNAAGLHAHFEDMLRRQLKGRYYRQRLRHMPAKRRIEAGGRRTDL